MSIAIRKKIVHMGKIIIAVVGNIATILFLLGIFGIIPEHISGVEFLTEYFAFVVSLALAIFFLFALWLGYQISTWRKPKTTQILQKGGQFYSSRKELPPLENFLGEAKQEIWFIGISNEKLIGQSAEAFKKALMRGVSIKFLFLTPDSKISQKWDEEMISATKKATEVAIARLCKKIKTLEESEKTKIEIFLYDLLPFNSFIVLDPRTSDAKIQVDLYLYNIEAELRPSIIISEKEQESLYMYYLKSFEFMLKNCTKYECPTNEPKPYKEV